MVQEQSTPYRVLARKYRPKHFDELIGQDALVRTLRNAIEKKRIAHAYMLTGIRGTGKTTTARIIAKALNYRGADGQSGPTTGATDDCEICRAITEDRHPDVMEMDAASRTGVDDIREILDGVRYAPVSARYKVYIIDEVHMLSKAAFNALLKTLEEPPEHVIFIFATTEIRKVPVTVLSRCQRFDLRRIDARVLGDYYSRIAEQEGVRVDDEAVALIARAADGSVRDGLSLLDQAIALAEGEDSVSLAQVQNMLGLADRGLILDILEHALKGTCGPALDIVSDLYAKGADPVVIVNDMLDFTHLMTRARAVPEMKEAHGAVAAETMARIADLAGKLSMPTLGRAWQILLKGLGEIQNAPNPQADAEMVVIRLAYAADLPDPRTLLKKLKDGTPAQAASPDAPSPPPASSSPAPQREAAPVAVAQGGGHGAAQARVVAPAPAPETVTEKALLSFEEIRTIDDIELVLRQAGQALLASELYYNISPHSIKPGQIDIAVSPEARPALAGDLGRVLQEITGQRWVVTVAQHNGGQTMAQRQEAALQARIDTARENPVVKTVLEIFPGAHLTVVDREESA